MLRLERAGNRREAQARASRENTRLALWRLDSALMPLLAQEAARPLRALRADRARSRRRLAGLRPRSCFTSRSRPEERSRRRKTARDDWRALRTALHGADVAARLPASRPHRRPASSVAANDQASVQKMKNVQEYAARQRELRNSVTPRWP